MEGLTEGRIVHYVLPEGRSKGQHRPAMVVRVWWGTAVNLQVFVDGSNDGYASGMTWRTSVHYDPDGAPDTWHWIERA